MQRQSRSHTSKPCPSAVPLLLFVVVFECLDVKKLNYLHRLGKTDHRRLLLPPLIKGVTGHSLLMDSEHLAAVYIQYAELRPLPPPPPGDDIALH